MAPRWPEEDTSRPQQTPRWPQESPTPEINMEPKCPQPSVSQLKLLRKYPPSLQLKLLPKYVQSPQLKPLPKIYPIPSANNAAQNTPHPLG